MKGVIDRIEEGIAVIEFDDGGQLEIPAKYVAGAREGLVVEIRVDERETAKRKLDISKLQRDLLAGKHLKNKKKRA
ncbi:MAG: hypothetical protein A3G34_00940 [Candidatus Lindowbacteria bacterium RIFCSPLOWO2_12_FULL_62_27]|nr:MAG: hypothetical protein A3G34_00940 [Candidatus Lindowbacteria bacterium RIFCSPLOWO2_12_FULL_62_27]OGH58274.1 MAG: hypothetical protein A3I06_09085 [Candidatus Lindowbacteria bacterium RIFCSPLOWO2_02_FULL_62_12]